MKEVDISKAICEEYNNKLMSHLENDVIVVGAGPAGLTAAYYLAKAGIKTIVLERKLSIGGGIWGGAAGYNVVVFEDTQITDEMGISTKKKDSLYVANAVELAAALAYKSSTAGVQIFNLLEAEDIIVKKDTVMGVVVNGTAIRMGGLHVDPFCIASKYVIDATGHPAEVVNMLKDRQPQLFSQRLREGFMDVETAEKGVVEKAGEIYPGLWVAGMSVCAVFGLPRMGPIFGGMLKSGKRVAELLINEKI